MRIAICDNDCIYRRGLRECIVEYTRNMRFRVNVEEFDSGEALLSSEKIFDLIFLAYRLPNANGMQIARKFRMQSIPGEIVFITDCPDFVYEAFEVSPYRFFIKPVEWKDIKAMLDSFFFEQKLLDPIIVIENGEQKIIPPKDIVYLEGNGKYCTIRTASETFYSSKTLSEVYSHLPKNVFYRIHKSYVVNMRCIASIENRNVTFINGEKAVISRNSLTDFKKTYMEFYSNFLRNV